MSTIVCGVKKRNYVNYCMVMANYQTLKEILLDFGAAVKNKRGQLGLSQEELADRAKLHRTYVTDIENGHRNVSLESITKLARALNLSLVELFSKIENNRNGGEAGKDENASFYKAVNILLVEDDSKHAELTMNGLAKNGITNPIRCVGTGEEALQILFEDEDGTTGKNRITPNVVFLDLSLPAMSGLDVLRLMRKDARTKSIPVIILTASRSDQDYRESIHLGVTAYITKPIDFLELANVIPAIGLSWLLVEQHLHH